MLTFKTAPAIIIALVLIVGVVYGAAIWIMDTEVSVDYHEAITIRMSDEERHPEWENITHRETTRIDEGNFSDSDPIDEYYAYAHLNNTDRGQEVNISVEIEEPEEFDDEMGFTILEGIVDPDNDENFTVDEWGSITHQVNLSAEEENFFTVVYTLSEELETKLNDRYVEWEYIDITDEEEGE